MGVKVTVDDIENVTNSSGVPTINENFDTVADEFDEVLYRDGSLAATGDMDMDGNRILNLPAPLSAGEPARLEDLEELTDAATVALLNAKANISDLAADDGAELIGFEQSGVGMLSQTAFTILRRNDVWLTDHSVVSDDGLFDNKTAFDATLAAAMVDQRALIIPPGEFKLSAVTLPTTGPIVIEGKGEDSQLIVNGANQTSLLSLISGGRLRMYNLRLVGDGTSSGLTNGTGLYIAGTDDIELDSLIFQNFGWNSIYGANYSATTPLTGSRLSMRNIWCLEGTNPNLSLNSADIYLRSGWSDVTLENLRLESALGSATHPVNVIVPSDDATFAGLLLLDATPHPATPEQPISDVKIRGVRAEGHTGWGIAIGSEYALPDTEMRGFQITDFSALNTGCAALKTKNVPKVQTNTIRARGCDRLGGEKPTSGLRGTLLFNANDSGTHSNLLLEDCWEDGVTMMGALLGEPEGALRGRHTINGLVVNGIDSGAVTGAAFHIPFGVYDTVVNGLVVNDAECGVLIRTAASQAAPNHITINSPLIKRTTSQAGIRILGLSGLNVGRVVVNSPDVSETYTSGVQVSFCDEFEMMGGKVESPGRGGSSGFALEILNGVGSLKVHGTRLVCADAVSGGSYGIRFAGAAATYAEIMNCDLSGNDTGPVLNTTPPTALRARNNREWLEATATVNPASIATGASTATATVTVTGAELGDSVEASFSVSLAGAQLITWVSATNTVSYYFTNTNGANPLDLASGTLSVKVLKG